MNSDAHFNSQNKYVVFDVDVSVYLNLKSCMNVGHITCCILFLMP